MTGLVIIPRGITAAHSADNAKITHRRLDHLWTQIFLLQWKQRQRSKKKSESGGSERDFLFRQLSLSSVRLSGSLPAQPDAQDMNIKTKSQLQLLKWCETVQQNHGLSRLLDREKSLFLIDNPTKTTTKSNSAVLFQHHSQKILSAQLIKLLQISSWRVIHVDWSLSKLSKSFMVYTLNLTTQMWENLALHLWSCFTLLLLRMLWKCHRSTG